MKKSHLVAGALTCSLLLNSCYFNSAGHIFDKASYQAASVTRELEANKNQVVYTDGEDYYVELTRFRMGDPVKTQYSAFDQESEDSAPKLEARGKDMFQIPKDFAMYLTGKAKGPDVPKEMTRIENADWIKSSCTTMPIVKNAGKYAEVWQQKSSAAPWLYMAGGLDWLCVDLPITLVENTLVVAGVATAIPVMMFVESQQKNSRAYQNRGNHGTDTCSTCGGDGTITKTYKDFVSEDATTRYYVNRSYEDKCPSCGGSGSQSHANRRTTGKLLDTVIFGRPSNNGSLIGNFL